MTSRLQQYIAGYIVANFDVIQPDIAQYSLVHENYFFVSALIFLKACLRNLILIFQNKSFFVILTSLKMLL